VLADRARSWAEAFAPSAVVDVTAMGGGITETKWLLHLAKGDPLVIRWSDPQVCLRQGGQLDRDRDASRFWAVSDVLGFLPDPAHILAAVASSRPDLSPDAVRHGLEDLLALRLA
jgi:hypothetical protein